MYSLCVCVSLTLMLGLVHTLPDTSLLLNSRVLPAENCNTSDNWQILGCNANCTGLKVCAYGEVQEVDCKAQNGKPYCNVDTKECVTTATLCPAPPGKFICPTRDGYYPDPLDCTIFYFCFRNKPNLRQCTEGVFNANLQTCEIGSMCYTFSSIHGLCRGKTGKMVGHPTAPYLYAYCHEDYPILGSCAPGTEFNEKVSGCQYKCTEIGIFPDYVDIHSYYTCKKEGTGFVATHGTCPGKKIFSWKLNTCV